MIIPEMGFTDMWGQIEQIEAHDLQIFYTHRKLGLLIEGEAAWWKNK